MGLSVNFALSKSRFGETSIRESGGECMICITFSCEKCIGNFGVKIFELINSDSAFSSFDIFAGFPPHTVLLTKSAARLMAEGMATTSTLWYWDSSMEKDWMGWFVDAYDLTNWSTAESVRRKTLFLLASIKILFFSRA